MDDLITKVAYLKGMANGLNIGEDTKEGKLLLKLLDIVEELSDAVVDLQDDQDDLLEYAEAIDQDLTDLEDDYYEDIVDEEDFDGEEIDEDFEGDYFTVECPDCKEIVYLDEELLEEDDTLEILCPKCERVVFVNDDHWDEETPEDENDNE